MCGINGIFHPHNAIADSKSKIISMNAALEHRGPDDKGFYIDNCIALGHQRLSIIDLSKDGHQPFTSGDDNYIIVYNGELYNYQEIRSSLTNYVFKTNTDTEVILAAFIEYGPKCLALFNGMFSFAIWDKSKEELFIARDRIGIKPLYYSKMENIVVFSSELRALLASDAVPRKLNKEVLPEYVQYQTVHAPNTIIKDVFVLPAGNYLKVTKQKEEIVCYWNPNKFIGSKIEKESEETITENIAQLLRKSIQRRMIADVPYGAFLSGGIDSSIIVGLMSEVATKPVNTFSVTFDEREFTEAKYSNIVAEHFGTNHREIQLKVEDFIKELPNALASMDHPSGDGPNSYIVSKVTKKAGVTMALSGLGGDELFAGYSIFKQAYDIKSKDYLNKVPRVARRIGGQILNKIKGDVSGEKMAEILALTKVTPASIYPIYRKALVDKQVNNLFDSRVTANVDILKSQSILRNDSSNVLSEVSLYEMATYMQNVLLRDTDQMSMASSLEVRVPFLDHELVEYVLAVADSIKYPHAPKKLLTDAMKGLVPEEVINRPKMGFVFPWKEWLKGELKQFCDSNISAIENRGMYRKGAITQLWNAFLNDDPKVTWSRVWHVIVLEDWMQRNSIEL